MQKKKMRIACFGFRSLPPKDGSAGADKFALELLPRLAAKGHTVTAYNRDYSSGAEKQLSEYKGVNIVSFRTMSKSGFDTFFHSARATYDIIRNNRADIVHIQNGGNSIFALILRMAGKKTFLSQDGIDWTRDKWPWYAKLFLKASSHLTARVHNAVIFDNIFAREQFEKRFSKKYDFIPFGSDVSLDFQGSEILNKLGLEPNKYFLFVGRFIPDKDVLTLVRAFKEINTDKKLVLVGGAPNPSQYEAKILQEIGDNIIAPGFLYGDDVHQLMSNCFAYVQPSLIEGLSPVILEASFLGAPLICSNIEQNEYAMGDNAMYFGVGDVDDLAAVLQTADDNEEKLKELALRGQENTMERFSWDAVTNLHIDLFEKK